MEENYITPCFRLFALSILFYFSSQALSSQNLVINPSFEDAEKCPDEFGSFHEVVRSWNCPTNGSTDYFSDCSDNMDVFRNFAGSQKVFDGNSYAGFYAYGPKDYREYLEGELKYTLHKGTKYIVTARVSLANKSGYAIDELGFLFDDKALEFNTTRNIPYDQMVQSGRSDYLGIINPKYYADQSKWIEIKSSFIAKGTERFLIFGNFKENKETKLKLTDKKLKKSAYYYIDMISVEEANESFKIKEIYLVEGINYATNGFQLKESSRKRLKELVEYLKQNPSLILTINGHTDNEGDRVYNRKLSAKRAKAVGLFLSDNGLSPFRIAWKGYGDSKPIVTNKTKKGREQNRRVEFVISKRNREFYASGVFEDDDED